MRAKKERGREGKRRRVEATFDQRAKSLRNKPRLMTPNNMDGMLVGGRGGEESLC